MRSLFSATVDIRFLLSDSTDDAKINVELFRCVTCALVVCVNSFDTCNYLLFKDYFVLAESGFVAEARIMPFPVEW